MKYNKPVSATSIPLPEQHSIYPEPFRSLLDGRTKRKLGDYFGLTNFGVNLTRLEPGAISALLHHHSRQDEFIYILEGAPTLLLGENEHILVTGDCAGVKAGTGQASQLVNRSSEVVVYLEIGDRTEGDQAEYPNDDLRAEQQDGVWIFSHKDGRPY